MASNSGDTWIKALLDSLQALLSKLSVLILNRRMGSYRKEGAAPHDRQILSALYDMVDKTSAPQDPTSIADDTANAVQTGDRSSGVSSSASGKTERNTVSETLQTDLSNHLRRSRSNASDAKSFGVKLKTAVWDHIHTSLRYTRQGNVDLAKMHADLAGEALQQASHHMTDEEYIEFKASILEELKKLHK
jgi:hypothetical protein